MQKPLRFITAALALCLALCSVSALAQTSTTGSIEGNVVDVNGAAVPGVTVSVSSPNLIRPQTATTNEEGAYRIPNLPPGRYTVTVEASKGFGQFKQEEVEVNLSRTSTVEIQLRPAGTTESVDVSASSGAVIDTATNTSGTNVSTEQFSNFPTQRTVQSLYTIAPTVTRSGLVDASGRERDPSVAGSSGPENNYILDGVNTTDPAFGGSGANLPFEFIQEVEIKTGAYGAEYGRATGGIFNVITKSGGNEFHGDVFGYGSTKGMTREVKNFPFTGAIPTAFSELDAGADVGGPIVKNKLWFFGAFNPQRRSNQFLTQTLRQQVENKITTPFYAGKVTWGINQNHTFTFSTFGDFTKQEGFLFRLNQRTPDSGFGANPNSFEGIIETGGSNYVTRLNSTFTPNFVGEFLFGLHFQRANTHPNGAQGDVPLVTDLFAVVRNGAVVPVTDTNVQVNSATPFTAFVDGRGGQVVRNYTRQGFGLISDQNRDRVEFAGRLSNTWKQHTFKYGFEFNENRYNIFTRSSGGARTFADPFDEELFDSNGNPVPAARRATSMPGGVRVTNRFGVCTATSATTVQCPAAGLTNRLNAAVTAGVGPAGITTVITNPALTDAQLNVNPILVLNTVRVRDFLLDTHGDPTKTRVESTYIQDDIRVTKDLQLNLGLRWDFQQAYGARGTTYVKLNKWMDNIQPRLGFAYDFTHRGRGKVFANYARYVETPLPLDLNVRAGGDEVQFDKNINASRLNAPVGSYIVAGSASGLGCLGCHPTPVDFDLKPQTVDEWTAGLQYEVRRDLALGFRGIYRAQGHVIEDGSFDDGTTYFLFNPGESLTDRVARTRPETNFESFGRARRYYRGLEFTATKRFTNNYQFIASYVFSSLIGNYEGLFRNDNGQSDPNITSLFDLVSLLANTYGRLPNDRPHQFKFNGSYRTPWKLTLSANFYANSGVPFNLLVPHPVYGENEGFAFPRGTSVFPSDAPGGIKAGRNRGPAYSQLDIGAYYPIQFGEDRQLRFQLDWFNALNSQRALRFDETVRFSNGIPGAGDTRFLNPFAGSGLAFQFPSTLRLGVKFSF